MSEVARRHGVAANLLFRWRKLLADGGAAAVGSDEEVIGASEIRKLEVRTRELERQLGRKTLEVELLAGGWRTYTKHVARIAGCYADCIQSALATPMFKTVFNPS